MTAGKPAPARRPLPAPPVLVITDRKQAARPLEEIAEAAFAAGCRWLSLREKDLPPPERLALARRLLPLAEARGATLTVHDDLETAKHLHGLHLPRQGDVTAARAALGAATLIGLSAHGRAEAEAAARAGADYVTLSPIFESASKPGYGPALGLDSLSEIARALPVPVIALGGVTAATAAGCLAAGAAGIAVMGPVMGAEDPERAVAAIVAAAG